MVFFNPDGSIVCVGLVGGYRDVSRSSLVQISVSIPVPMSDPLPTFETDRLLIRPRTMADYEACLAMDRDPLVTRFIDGPWHDADAHERFLRERIQFDISALIVDNPGLNLTVGYIVGKRSSPLHTAASKPSQQIFGTSRRAIVTVADINRKPFGEICRIPSELKPSISSNGRLGTRSTFRTLI